jgi:1,4-dihydroxy-2-naphthoyl-CoA synthase
MRDRFSTVLLEVSGAVAKLTLNRPQKLKCFTNDMHDELREALLCVESQSRSGEIRALLFTGARRAFCAGQDLTERRRAAADPLQDLEQRRIIRESDKTGFGGGGNPVLRVSSGNSVEAIRNGLNLGDVYLGFANSCQTCCRRENHESPRPPGS